NPSTIFVGNDGGVYESIDRGQSWRSLNNGLAITQFYPGISVGPTSVADYLGGTQDNGTLELFTGGSVWLQALSGDGGFTAINYEPPTSYDAPTTAFAECQWAGKPEDKCGPFRRDGHGFFQQKRKGILLQDKGVFEPPLVMDPVKPE